MYTNLLALQNIRRVSLKYHKRILYFLLVLFNGKFFLLLTNYILYCMLKNFFNIKKALFYFSEKKFCIYKIYFGAYILSIFDK